MDLREQSHVVGREGVNANQVVADEAVALSVLTGLTRLARHARDRAAAGGNALIKARILPATGIDAGLQIGHNRRGFVDPRSTVALPP